ncbi:hypothetical protein, partial [Citrobacter sp. CtB7.12]|uniref:hypothetical protein n=1 Tax=Citrobacter sp. CtB7.12 TaxID=1696093 RepID=UPI0006BA14E0
KWSADRKFSFGETANFQAPRPPANVRPKRTEQAGGSRKNFATPVSEKLSPTTAVFVGGTAPHTVAAKPVFRRGETSPFKATFPAFSRGRENNG